MGAPFDPSQLSPSLWPDFNAGFSTFNAADFEAPDVSHPQYLSAGGVPAGWGGGAKFTLFGFVLIDPTLRGNNFSLCSVMNAGGSESMFTVFRNASNFLEVHLARSLSDTAGAQAAGSLLVMGNSEQPGTANSGQGRIAWGLVFDGTQTGNANRLKLYVQGAHDTGATYANAVPAALTSPSGAGVSFLLGYDLWNGAPAQRVQLYNVGVLAGYAASGAEMAALANLAAGSKYPKHWAWGALPSGAPAAGNFSNFWSLGEASTGAAPVSRADSVGTATLTDGLGAGGNVASAATASCNDLSGHDNYGTSPTVQTLAGVACTTPQAATGPNGRNAVHFATAVGVNSYLRFGQLGMTTLPASWTHLAVVNYDFADAANEMQCCGTDVNSATVSVQASPNALEPMDNDDFGITQGHPATVSTVVGDGTNYNAFTSGINTIKPGTWQVFIQRYSPNNCDLMVDGVPEALANIGANPFWAPGGGAGTNYTTPLSGSPAQAMAEWSVGGVGNTDQAASNAAWLGAFVEEMFIPARITDAQRLQLAVWAALKDQGSVPSVLVPAAPAGLGVTPAPTGLSLSWGAITGATSYNVYRGTSSGGEALLANSTPDSYLDSSGVTGTAYYYKVAALIETTAGTSTGAQSSEASAQFPPQQPQGLSASRTGAVQITLAWSAVAGATSYKVYRGTSSGGESFLATAASNAYVDNAVALGGTYYYEVTSLFNSVESVRSVEASASLPITAAVDVIDRLNFPQPARRALTPLVTTGIAPYAVGTVLTFQGAFFLNHVYWDLTGGAVTLEVVDPSGNVTGPLAATISGGSPSVTYTVAAPGGQWYRKWTITDAQGRHQVSPPEAFSVDASP